MSGLKHFKRRPRRGQPRFNPDREYVEKATVEFLKRGAIDMIESKDSYQLANHLTPRTPQQFLNPGGPTRKI